MSDEFKKNIKEIISAKTLINRQVQNDKTNEIIKNIYKSKSKRERSHSNRKNYSISDSRDISNINHNRKNNTNSYHNKKNSKNKKIISSIFYTTRKCNVNKNYLINEKKFYSISKKKNHLTKSHPLLNENLLYQLSFNNHNNENNTYRKYSGVNYSLKKKNDKNNIQVYQGIDKNYISKNKKYKKEGIKKNQLIINNKSKIFSNKSNSYSTTKNHKIINSNQNINCFEINQNNDINENICMSNNIIDNLNEEIKRLKGDNNTNENKNAINRKYKLLNEEMMKKIKNTLDDNLKFMFNFSYENFLSKESEQESKDHTFEKEQEN